MPISISSEFTVNSNTAGNQTGPFVAMVGDGSFVCCWTEVSSVDGVSRVRTQGFDRNFALNTNATSVLVFDYTETASVIGITGLESSVNGPTFAVASKLSSPQSLPGQSDLVMNFLGGGIVGPGGQLHQNSHTILVESSAYSYTSASMTDFGVPLIIYAGPREVGGSSDIGYMTISDRQGSSLSKFPLNTTTDGEQFDASLTWLSYFNPATGSVSTEFLAWTSQSGADSEIRGITRFTENDFPIAHAAGHALSHAAAESLGNARVAVAWLVDENSTSSSIDLKLFDDHGAGKSRVITVSADSTDDYFKPALMSLNDGRLLAVYAAHDSTSGDYEIRARILSEAGTQIGSEFVIGSAGNNPAVTFDLTRGYAPSDLIDTGPYTRNGKIVVTWDKYVGPDDGTDIVAVTLDPGTYSGTELADTWVGGNLSDTIYGKGGADRLAGSAGNDRIAGDAGNDSIIGGRGADRLTGGAGSDYFTFGTKTDSGDTIVDFGKADFFTFKGVNFGHIKKGVLTSDEFCARANDVRAQDTNDHFIFRQSDDTLWFDANGNGAGGLTKIADLATDFNLKAGDILIV